MPLPFYSPNLSFGNITVNFPGCSGCQLIPVFDLNACSGFQPGYGSRACVHSMFYGLFLLQSHVKWTCALLTCPERHFAAQRAFSNSRISESLALHLRYIRHNPHPRQRKSSSLPPKYQHQRLLCATSGPTLAPGTGANFGIDINGVFSHNGRVYWTNSGTGIVYSQPFDNFV